MKQKIFKENGITLIALVITIIVLLILAGVTINIAVNSGIMDKSEKAVSKYTEQEAKESLAIALLDYQMGMLAKDNSSLQDYLTDMGGVVTEETDDAYTVELGGYEFIIDKNSLGTTSLGETKGEKPNVGTPSVSLSSNGLEATITVSASATQGGNLTVTIGEKTATDNGDGTYSVTVDKNGKYSILVIEEGGRKAATSIKITEIAVTAIISSGNNISGNANGTITGNDYAYNNPVIPVGFKTSTAGASWTESNGIVTGWDDGLVIQDNDGNEFVWVPVDNTNVTYNKWLGEKNHSNITSLDVLSDDSIPTKVTSTWSQNETSQITKYGGFYIARYEAGIPSSLSTAQTTASADARNVSGTPVSKQNQVPWDYIDYTTSKTNAESMYSTNYVQSGLVTGTMWDATMKWLENASVNVQTDSTAWGNYNDATVTGITSYSTDYGASWSDASSKPSESSYLLKTGNSDYTKRKNIYDLAGNLWEWTAEKNYDYRVVRNGSFLDSGSIYPASGRTFAVTSYTNTHFGFRVGLYIK